MTYPAADARQLLLDADTHTHEDTVVITVHGEIDLWSLPVFDQLLASHGRAQRMVVDLSELTFCCVAGARCLRDASARANAVGNRLDVIPTRWLVRLLTVTGFDNAVHQLTLSDWQSEQTWTARHAQPQVLIR